MNRLTTATVILGITTSVAAQSGSAVTSASGAVVSVFLLDSNPQALVASQVGEANSLTTLAVQCKPDTSEENCGYPSGFALTYNPGTVQLTAVSGALTGEFGCTLTGTSSGSCSITYIGPASDLASVVDASVEVTATEISTISTDAVLTEGDITLNPITITAGAAAASTSSASSFQSGTSSASSNTEAGAGVDISAGSSTSASASVSASASANESSNAASAGASQSSSSGSASHTAGAGESSNGGSSAGTSTNSGLGSSSTSAVTSSRTGGGTTTAAGAPFSTSFNVGTHLIAPGMLGAALLGLAAYL